MCRLLLIVLVPLFLCFGSGCKALRSLINTQPRVEVQPSAYADPAKVVGGTAVVYEPAQGKGPDAPGMALLAQYAPLLIQGIPPKGKADYDPSSDAVGTPRLTRLADGTYSVGIDPAEPRMYARVERARVGDRELTQLVYVFWYPRRPVGAVQQGDVDGGVLRVTLDAAGRRALYEHAQTCGCLHGVFVGEHVEAWAHDEFGAPKDGRKYAVERHVEGKTDWVVRDLVHGWEESARPVLFLSAGGHECVALQTTEVVAAAPALLHRAYSLLPYEALTTLPVANAQGEKGSMFDAKGLVWGAKRSREEIVFSDLDHPGWPRQLDKMRIAWDEESWNDPTLLDRYLRLPREVNDAAAVAHVPGAAAPVAPGAPLPQAITEALRQGKPVAVLVGSRLCIGCRAVHQDVLPRPEVQAAGASWTWVEADIEDPLGRELATRYRVDATPTLVLLDGKGKESRRVVEIATPSQFVDALGGR